MKDVSLIVLVFVVLCIFVSLFKGVFVKEDVALRTARINGFTEIKVVDKAWFLPMIRGCSQRDAVRFTVKARNYQGENVEFYVCSGWLFKAATIRVP